MRVFRFKYATLAISYVTCGYHKRGSLLFFCWMEVSWESGSSETINYDERHASKTERGVHTPKKWRILFRKFLPYLVNLGPQKTLRCPPSIYIYKMDMKRRQKRQQTVWPFHICVVVTSKEFRLPQFSRWTWVERRCITNRTISYSVRWQTITTWTYVFVKFPEPSSLTFLFYITKCNQRNLQSGFQGNWIKTYKR